MDPFKDIRPYTDAEVAEVLRSLTSNPSVLKAFKTEGLDVSDLRTSATSASV